MRFKKLKGPGIVLWAARHNLRELPPTPNINPEKHGANQVALGEQTAQAVYVAYKEMLHVAGDQKLRIDAVRAIECLISLPVGVQDTDGSYFAAALDWLGKAFGRHTLLSAVIHNDEAAQHMHVLVVPLIDGRMRGSDLLGQRKFHALLRSFEEAIAPACKNLGLAERSLQTKENMAREAIGCLQRLDDPMWQSVAAQILRNYIENDPAPMYEFLGCPQRARAALEAQHGPVAPDRIECSNVPAVRRPQRKKRQPTMTDIFIRPVRNMRGAKSERYRQSPEYLQAHCVQTLRVSDSSTGHCATSLPSEPEATAPSSLTAPATLAAPTLPQRTLCSVGFSLQRQAFLDGKALAVVATEPVIVATIDASMVRHPTAPLLQASVHRPIEQPKPGDSKARLDDSMVSRENLQPKRPLARAWQWPPARAPA